MGTESLNLQVGKHYKNRLGQTVRIIRNTLDRLYPFADDEDRFYTKDGYYWSDKRHNNLDLLEEVLPTDDDPVHHPSHYNHGGIECIEALEAALTPEEFRGYLKGNAMKYQWRGAHKGVPLQDANKALWYANRLVQTLEKQNGQSTTPTTSIETHSKRKGKKGKTKLRENRTAQSKGNQASGS